MKVFYIEQTEHKKLKNLLATKGLVAELVPPYIQSGFREERVRATVLATCCNYLK